MSRRPNQPSGSTILLRDAILSRPVRVCARCGREGRFDIVRVGGADWCERCVRERFRLQTRHGETDPGIVGALGGFARDPGEGQLTLEGQRRHRKRAARLR